MLIIPSVNWMINHLKIIIKCIRCKLFQKVVYHVNTFTFQIVVDTCRLTHWVALLLDRRKTFQLWLDKGWLGYAACQHGYVNKSMIIDGQMVYLALTLAKLFILLSSQRRVLAVLYVRLKLAFRVIVSLIIKLRYL